MSRFLLPRCPEEPGWHSKLVYTLNDFAAYHDVDFVRNAYRGILNREPDPEGLQNYLTLLRSGKLSKIEILGRLRYSPEGRRHRARIKFLLPCFIQQTLCRIPVLSWPLQFLISLIKLPLTQRNFQTFENYSHSRLAQMRHLFNTQAQCNEDYLNELKTLYGDLKNQLEELKGWHESVYLHCQRLDEQNHLLNQSDLQFAGKVAHLELRQDELQTQCNEQVQQYDHIKHCQDRLQIQCNEREHQHNSKITKLSHRLEQTEIAKADRGQVGELSQRVKQIEINKANLAQVAELSHQISQVEAQKADLAGHLQGRHEITALQHEITATQQQLLEHKRNILDQQRRLIALLENSYQYLAKPMDSISPEALQNQQAHMLDAMYVTFEDRFRGSRETVKKNLEVYLPYLQQAQAGISIAPVLDVGCGRGEWLELLREQGLMAKGLDINQMMVYECQQLHLDVIEADVIAYLREQAADSLGAITGFHIIEHLSLDTLVTLFDETLRVLKAGGVAIFETPNPENLVVGAYTFYLDPTHKNPLPPLTTQHLAELRGFTNVNILRLHPREEAGPVDEFKNKWFCSPVDYAIIACK